MASPIPPSLEHLITQLNKLPTIGRRSAERLAFHLVLAPIDQLDQLTEAMTIMREKLTFCSNCAILTEVDPCPICANPARQTGQLCVVEDALDGLALESAAAFEGRYHILGACLSPLKGITASDLNLAALDRRMETENVQEIIVALNPSPDGEATALFLSQRYIPQGVKVSRIALGLPMGGSLEHADGQTLQHALRGRTNLG